MCLHTAPEHRGELPTVNRRSAIFATRVPVPTRPRWTLSIGFRAKQAVLPWVLVLFCL